MLKTKQTSATPWTPWTLLRNPQKYWVSAGTGSKRPWTGIGHGLGRSCSIGESADYDGIFVGCAVTSNKATTAGMNILVVMPQQK